MKRTFNTKIIIFTISLLLVTIAVSGVYISGSVDFEDKDYVFLPLIAGLLLTLMRTYNNITEKGEIVKKLAAEREAGLDQSRIKFTTCPDYWTKETKEDAVYCKNEFTDSDGNVNLVGGPLAKAPGTMVDELKNSGTEDPTEKIGFAFAHTEDEKTNLHNFDEHESTYIPSMRKTGEPEETVEGFAEDVGDHDSIPHKHTRTFVNYAHTDKSVEWKDGVDRDHDKSAYKDGDHLLIYSEDVYHDHSGNGNLYDAKGNLIWGRAAVSSSDKEKNQGEAEVYENEFDNINHWISPHKKNEYMHAEINLNELNKKDNKCHLVKNFSWNEAKTKCDNVNVTFDQ